MFFLDEPDECRPLNFNRLTSFVVEGDDEVEEVWLAKIRRGLLLEVSSAQTHAEIRKVNTKHFMHTHVAKCCRQI